ncbi:hypothetical protein MVEG_12103 [Podila verticillata NRRL 6337]|uniref:Uncharacterized protein n=1 Tax=Podila verticillata NRRL 6337 TaxID=1069443 RepID=A0A086TJ22_9FUNG|nr:hypothetical protein MVEG_12103 [Podila verticillata NRRL 6337]
MSTSQEDTRLPLDNVNEEQQQQDDIQDRHQHQTEMQEVAEGNTTTPTRKILTPFSQKERQEAKLKLQAAMENSMELPAEETIAQLKTDVIQAEQDADQAVHVQAAKERSVRKLGCAFVCAGQIEEEQSQSGVRSEGSETS